MRRILFLSDVNSSHTRKWVTALAGKGFHVGIFSLHAPRTDWYADNERIELCNANDHATVNAAASSIGKSGYIKLLPQLKKAVRSFAPDIMHAHYATSYGMLGALSGFHPLIISVWGSDVYEFPRKSFLHRIILRHNLRKADLVFSTSNAMAAETSRYTKNTIEVTPFGVDTEEFRPMNVEAAFDAGDIVVGTIKALEDVYAIDVLMRAFAIVKSKNPNLPLRLLIVGDGSKREELTALADELKIANVTRFAGRVQPDVLAQYHNRISVFAALSRAESFGVAVVEAMACERPVVVSDAPGLAEVVENEKTGIIVKIDDTDAAAHALDKLVNDDQLRARLGHEGRRRVTELYDWNKNIAHAISIYNRLLGQNR